MSLTPARKKARKERLVLIAWLVGFMAILILGSTIANLFPDGDEPGRSLINSFVYTLHVFGAVAGFGLLLMTPVFIGGGIVSLALRRWPPKS